MPGTYTADQLEQRLAAISQVEPTADQEAMEPNDHPAYTDQTAVSTVDQLEQRLAGLMSGPAQSN